MSAQIDHILLVDDDLDDNYIHKMVISSTGLVKEVALAKDGSEALEVLQELWQQPSEPVRPNIIFLDINMPRMNGWDVLNALKEMGESAHQSMVVMLSTSQNPEDQEKAKAYPFVHGYLHKPLTEEALSEIVEAYLSKNKADS
ncbi:MAG: response regulator [Phaeodactylibacter sp.]|uniref:response regulator n=1 Tax=Phaeodactylibacter sp. TaxID=1940289 RepID=UPI0032EB2840